MASQWDYVVLRLSDARASHIADRVNQLGEDGYEPHMITGDENVTILMRRPKQEATEAPAE